MADNLQDKIIFSLNAMCLLKSSNCSKPFAPWMQNSEVKDARNRKNLLLRKLRKEKNNAHLPE